MSHQNDHVGELDYSGRCHPIGRRKWHGSAFFQRTEEGGLFIGADVRGMRNPNDYLGTYWSAAKVEAFVAFAGEV